MQVAGKLSRASSDMYCRKKLLKTDRQQKLNTYFEYRISSGGLKQHEHFGSSSVTVVQFNCSLCREPSRFPHSHHASAPSLRETLTRGDGEHQGTCRVARFIHPISLVFSDGFMIVVIFQQLLTLHKCSISHESKNTNSFSGASVIWILQMYIFFYKKSKHDLEQVETKCHVVYDTLYIHNYFMSCF